MEVSFTSNAKSVKDCSNKLETSLTELRNKSLSVKLGKTENLESTIKLIEKLSIINEYKLNLFKDFSKYTFQKK